MNFSNNEMTRVASLGFGGFVVASLFQIGNTVMAQRTNVRKLETATEVLHVMDERLYNMLIELEEHAKPLDAIAFIRLTDSIDRLLFLRRALVQKNIDPIQSDLEECNRLFQRAKRSMQRLIEKIESKVHAREAVQLQDLIKSIHKATKGHVVSVFSMAQLD
jgi:hypothetical protein